MTKIPALQPLKDILLDGQSRKSDLAKTLNAIDFIFSTGVSELEDYFDIQREDAVLPRWVNDLAKGKINYYALFLDRRFDRKIKDEYETVEFLIPGFKIKASETMQLFARNMSLKTKARKYKTKKQQEQ